MPIRWRLTLFNALIMCAILLVLGLSLLLLLRESLYSGVEATARSRAITAAKAVEAGESPLKDRDDVEELTADGVFLIVRDAQGAIIDRTTNFSPSKEMSDGVWDRVISSRKPEGGAADLSTEAPDYAYAVPVNPPDGSARVVEAAKSYDSVEDTLETFVTVLAAGGLAALLLSVAGAYLLARAALSPVEAVVGSAREMTEGDLSKRLPVSHPRDEIGRLTTTINAFLARLEAAFARREEALSRQRRFAADASHELRTPLTAISGHARMLDEWALEEDPQRAKRSVRAIRAAAARMRTLVESLLILTRGDESTGLEVGRNDLASVAEEATQAARTAADGKVSIEYVRPKRPVEATFDRDRVFQVATILLDNAVKYTNEGGSVLVRVEEEDGGAVLEVSDTGVGIPEDDLPLVFERFYRTDRSRTDSGVGLGLSIARQIAEAHGGEIRARSAPGKGSTFTLHLPHRPQPDP